MSEAHDEYYAAFKSSVQDMKRGLLEFQKSARRTAMHEILDRQRDWSSYGCNCVAELEEYMEAQGLL